MLSRISRILSFAHSALLVRTDSVSIHKMLKNCKLESLTICDALHNARWWCLEVRRVEGLPIEVVAVFSVR